MTNRALAILGVFLVTTAVAAQIKVDVQLVNVVATVTDSRGRYVPGLKASDFTLAEDGTRQEITHFAFSQDVPVSVGIVLDTSGSMEPKISTATRAIDRFLRDIHEDDDIFLMTFDSSVSLKQDFTSDRDRVWKAMEKIHVNGQTALYDGLVSGLEKIRKGKYQKKAILLLSDGVDTASAHSYDDARSRVRQSEVLVYALGISPDGGIFSSPTRVPGTPGTFPPTTGPRGPTTTSPGRSPIGIPLPGGGGITLPFPMPGQKPFPFASPSQIGQPSNGDEFDMKMLNTFADESGGKAWMVSADSRGRTRLQDALDEIADELRNQYSVGYYPGHDLKDGKWHRTQLETKNPDYRVRYKEDYFGK